MFGYIAINVKQLTDEQVARYKSWYCGLCYALRDRFGQAGRLTLSNDMTFLALLLSSLYEPREESGSSFCPIHPMKKRNWTRTRYTDYAADMNLLLAYWKCVDNSRDEGDATQARLARSMEKDVEAIRERYPAQYEGVRSALEAIGRLEAEDSRDVDALCDQSGRMLAAIFAPEEDAFAPMLRQLGYQMGRFIYLMDAWEDYDEDQKKGRFNPLTELHGQADYEETIHDLLLMLMGEAKQAYDLLPLERDVELTDNVMLHGVWGRYAALTQKKNGRRAGDNDPGEDCAEADGEVNPA